MRLQREVLYAIDVVGIIVQAQERAPGKFVTARELSEGLGISTGFTQKIANKLWHAGVLLAFRGPAGGYRTLKAPSKITIGQIVSAIQPEQVQSLDSNMLRTETALGQRVCETLQEASNGFFDTILEELVKPRNAGLSER